MAGTQREANDWHAFYLEGGKEGKKAHHYLGLKNTSRSDTTETEPKMLFWGQFKRPFCLVLSTRTLFAF